MLLAAAAIDFDPTLSVGLGYDLHLMEEPIPGGLAWSIRGGLQGRSLDLELAVLGHGGEAAGSDWPASVVSPRLELMWHPDHRLDVDPFVGGGVGYRYVRIDDGTRDKSLVEERYGFEGDPVLDLVVTGGGGATWTLWGPLHLRADLRGLLILGPDRGGYVLGAGEGVLALEYRDEGPPDADRDGVADKKDVCPQSMEDQDGHEDLDGCLDPDDDRDGALDGDDRCKDDAEDRDGFQDEDGCPDPNNDMDNRADADDRCPDEAETENSFEDGDGCPDSVPPELAAIDDRPVAGLAWTGRELDPASLPAVDTLAALLLRWPSVRVAIKCYTDNVGEMTPLRDLSLARAEDLEKLLVERGVAEDRVTPDGWGDRFPVAPNDTEEGRKKNNRCIVLRED